jgi:hypothetical protein
MKNSIFILILLLISVVATAQLKPGSKVYFVFEETVEEVNVDGEDALEMLRSYVKGKSSLQIVDSKEKSEFTFILSVIEKNMGKRKGKIVILENKSNNVIFNTDWQKANSSAFYGYSGTRAVIGKMMKHYILEEFPEIYVDNN